MLQKDGGRIEVWLVLHPHPHTPSIHASLPPVVSHHLKRHGAFNYRCPDIAYPHLVFHEALGYGHRVGAADRCCLRVGGAKGHKQEGACIRGGVVLGYMALYSVSLPLHFCWSAEQRFLHTYTERFNYDVTD